MYPISEAYKDAILKNDVLTDIRGNIALLDGSIIPITGDDIIGNTLSFQEQCISSENLDIATVYASELSISIFAIDNPFRLDGARIALEYGLYTGSNFEYIPLGHYYVTDIQRQIDGVALKALDGMLLLDIDMVGIPTAGSSYQLVAALCSKCGVTLSTTSLQFASFANNEVILTIPDEGKVKTCRDLLMWICQVTCTFARFDRYGGLELISVSGNMPVRTIDAHSRYSSKISDYSVKITQVEMLVGDTLHSIGTEGMTMSLDENPLFVGKTEEEVGLILADILAFVTTCEYTPCEIDYIGDPALQPGDFVLVTDLQGEDIMVYITNSNWTFRGSHKITSKGQASTIRSDYSQANKSITAVRTQAKKASQDAEQAKQTANSAMQSANEKNTIFRQPDEPSIVGRKVNDTWFDTDDDNHIYTFDGAKWVSAQLGSGAIAEGSIAKEKLEVELKQELEENKQAIASKNSVYRQETAPTGGNYIAGDMWLDTANGNAIHTYDGTDWAPAYIGNKAIEDGAITGNKIGHGVIDADNIAQGAITADKIMDGIINEAKFNIKTHLLF